MSIFSKDACVITYSLVLKTEFTACSVSFFMEMKKRAVVQYMKKNDRSSELSGKKTGWNFSSAAENGEVEGGMLLQLRDQVMQAD